MEVGDSVQFDFVGELESNSAASAEVRKSARVTVLRVFRARG